ncbi:phage head morphogenesis protein [Niabella sp. W65]|nr:phage head morphogenesis protein [Niabella sp. W65]MCH7368526.1 phage head morphogenesis protein [Niabella sp. W65]
MHPVAAADDLPVWLSAIIEEIWKEKGVKGNTDAARSWYNDLWANVQQGYGQMLDDIYLDSPDYAMLKQLQRDVVKFSNAKDYAMQRAMVEALQDANGNVRSKGDYRTIAYSIGKVHNEAWLNTERDFSIASAQMASKWLQFESSKEVMDLLEFDAILDKNTTQTCRGLDGIIEPFDHWFWAIYYPPNHFGCRSTARQKATGTSTDLKTFTCQKSLKCFKPIWLNQGLYTHPVILIIILYNELRKQIKSRYKGSAAGAGKRGCKFYARKFSQARFSGWQWVAGLGKAQAQ